MRGEGVLAELWGGGTSFLSLERVFHDTEFVVGAIGGGVGGL